MSDLKGVQLQDPPGPILAAATKMVLEATAQLSPTAHGGIFPIVTTKGANAAIVSRVGEHFRVVAWVGKTWGRPIEAGGAGVIEW